MLPIVPSKAKISNVECQSRIKMKQELKLVKGEFNYSQYTLRRTNEYTKVVLFLHCELMLHR